MDRRTFLSASSTIAAALMVRRTGFAEPVPVVDERTLVVIQLHGGNDGFNTLIREDDDYARARPDLVPPASKRNALEAGVALHPALVHVREHYLEGRVGVVEGVGWARSSLSHFRSEAVWEAGGEADLRANAGWIGRWYDDQVARGVVTVSPLGLVALGRDVRPSALRSRSLRAPVIPDFRTFARSTRARRRDLDDVMPATDTTSRAEVGLADAARRSALDAGARLSAIATEAGHGGYPDCDLGRNLEAAARLVTARAGTRVVYVTHSGYDTHTTQACDHGHLLAELDGSLHAFLKDLAARGVLEQTLVLTVSEFGRRLAQNGTRAEAGTDHGRASIAFLAGGAARPGLHGVRPDFANVDEDGNVPARVELRSVFSNVVDRWLGGDSRTVFRETTEPIDLVRS